MQSILSGTYGQQKVRLIDFEKVIESGFSGMNTRARDVLNVHFDHEDTNPKKYAHQMQVVLHSDNIVETRDGGVTVLDYKILNTNARMDIL